MRTNPLRLLVSGLAFGLAFVVNPAYLSGCAPGEDDEPDLAKIEAELDEELDMLNGQPALSFSYEGEDYEVLLALTRQEGEDESARAPGARFTSTAHACGTHTFFQSASACATLYNLAVEGTVTLRRLGENASTVASDLAVTGTVGYGMAVLTLADGGFLRLEMGEDGYDLSVLEAQDLGEAMLDFMYSAY